MSTVTSMLSVETFQEVWDRTARSHPDRVFLTFRDVDGLVSEWTFAETDHLADRVAARLVDLGVGPGDPVQIVLRNCPAFVVLWLAISRVGAWMVPVDPASAARDIDTQVTRIAPRVIVHALDRVGPIREGLGSRGCATVAVTETAADLADSSPLVAAGRLARDHVPAATDRLAVMFTSGTTSAPKGVILTQANYAHVGATMAELAGLGPQHRWYVCLPLFHANAQYYCFASAIAVGASVALTARFTASRWPHEVAELGATHASLFAAPIRMILARRRDDAPTLGLRHLWFAQNLAAGQWQEMADLCGVAPRQIYGMTETIAVVTANPVQAASPSLIGRPAPGRDVVLISPADGRVVEDGPGILTVAGRRGIDLFCGYLDNEVATARAFAPIPLDPPEPGMDWFSTGDLVRRAADGQLAFVGRVDDVIKVAGENVSLTEVEAAIAEIPGVLEAAVIAIPDPIRDQVPAAFVVPRDLDSPPTPADLEQWAEHHLVPAARPRNWTVIEELPRTSVGKIRRFQLSLDQPATSEENRSHEPA